MARELIHLAHRVLVLRTRSASMFLVGVALIFLPRLACADRPEAPAPSARHSAGQLIRLPLPITGNLDTQIKKKVSAVIKKLPAGGERPVLVLEFAPQRNESGAGSDFTRALSLARYLSSRDLSTVKTVAFLPRSIKGHSVLVALACEEIVMAPDAVIGAAGIDEPAGEPIDPTVRLGYREIADRRRSVPAEIALGMLDRELEVLKIETEVSTEYVFRQDLEARVKGRSIQPPRVIIPAGQFGQFTGREARALGFAKYLAADRAALARALTLPRKSLEEDPSLAGDWKPVLLNIHGPINGGGLDLMRKAISTQIETKGANFVCINISSPGGSFSDSMTFANFLADLESGTVRTVAYVPDQARADASLIAMACDELVMEPDAILGGAGAEAISADDAHEVRISIKNSLAARKSRSWSLPAALIDPKLPVHRYKHREKGLVEYFSVDELEQQPDPLKWERGELVTAAGRPLMLRGRDAERLGLARHVVNNVDELRQIYGIEELASIEPGWAERLINALAAPGIRWLLLLIGGAALYVELQAPGIGLGGFISGMCFLLYFWSSHLEGTAGWLEVLLFAAGVSCLLLEFFVLPGTGVFGLGGGLLVLASLILASQTFIWPQNEYQFDQMRDSLAGLAFAGLGVIVLAVALRRFLPHTPMFGHMVLEPPSDLELEDLSHREALVALEHLLGAQGTAVTPLVPAGKARVADQLLDVISDGEFIDRGATIQVAEVHGNRVIVRRV